MKKLTESQKAKRIASIIRFNDLNDGTATISLEGLATVIMGANLLNTPQAHSSAANTAMDQINQISHHNRYNDNDQQINDLVNLACKGSISEAQARILAQYSLDNL